MLKYFTNLLLGLLSLTIVLLVGFWFFCSITEIDKTITNGNGYGFKIGDSKDLSYKKAIKLINEGELVGFDNIYKNNTQRCEYPSRY